jgi:hypothetical protein
MTAAPDPGKIKNLTFRTTTTHERTKSRASWGAGEIAASVFILACILGAYLYFTG